MALGVHPGVIYTHCHFLAFLTLAAFVTLLVCFLDASAIALARDNAIPIIVFSLDEPGGFRGILAGQGTYTVVHG